MEYTRKQDNNPWNTARDKEAEESIKTQKEESRPKTAEKDTHTNIISNPVKPKPINNTSNSNLSSSFTEGKPNPMALQPNPTAGPTTT